MSVVDVCPECRGTGVLEIVDDGCDGDSPAVVVEVHICECISARPEPK